MPRLRGIDFNLRVVCGRLHQVSRLIREIALDYSKID